MLACSLALGVSGPARSAEPPVLTSPGQHTDSYYPSVGSPTVDVQSYALDLRWQPTTRTLVGVARLRPSPPGTAPSASTSPAGCAWPR